MHEVPLRLATAAALLWLGMVLAISFLEAPLKFRAPGLELPVALAIGRIVFRALNLVEIVWAVVVGVCLALRPQSSAVTVLAIASGALLAVQVGLVRPRLNRRTDQVLASRTGADVPRSRAHHAYIALEGLKVIALAALSWSLLSA